MVNPQPTDAHLRIAHSISEEILMRNFSKRQRSILDLILRLSWGCGKKEAIIPKLRYFEICGVPKTKIKDEIIFLVNARVITWMQETNIYWFNKNYDEWKISIVKGYDRELLDELIHLNLKNDSLQKGNKVPKKGTNFPKREQSSHFDRGTQFPKRELFEPANEVNSTDTGVPKESIKESIYNTTTITTVIGDGEEENKKDNFVADMEADSIQQDISFVDESIYSTPQEDFSMESKSLGEVCPVEDREGNTLEDQSNLRKIEQHYAKKLKRIPSSKDLQAMLEVYSKGYPVEFILRCVDTAYERNLKANGKIAIYSFKYFIPIIEDEWVKEQARIQAKTINEKAPSVDFHKVMRKKIPKGQSGFRQRPNKFHNFEQRTSKYSKEELEALLKKKVKQGLIEHV